MLNKAKGNMYPWVDATWNVIKGKCPHDCSYCYMRRYPQPELHFDERELKTNLGSGNTIFVGSSCDMWADYIPDGWIDKVLHHCDEHISNRYLFQTKNPMRFIEYSATWLPDNVILGTTIETNRHYDFISKAPRTEQRKAVFEEIGSYPVPVMVSIEPVMDFDLDVMGRWIRDIKPEFVSIGADSGGHNLPEPSQEKIQSLIEGIQELTEVKLKDNLNRLLRQEMPK